MKSERNSIWQVMSGISFFISVVTLVLGLDKMFNYDSGESFPYEYHNAYVGGDAYNYIINSNYATGFFVLATLFALLGVGFIIVYYLHKSDSTQELLAEQNLLKEKLAEQSSLVEYFIQREQGELDQINSSGDPHSSDTKTLSE